MSLAGKWLQEAGAGLLDLLYPPRCVVCREPGPERFCRSCRAAIEPASLITSAGSVLAGRAAVGLYEGPLRQAVIYLKYQDRRALAIDLAALMAVCLEEHRDAWRPDALTPVPIHPVRRRERGYNQSELLASALAHRCGLPVRETLTRVRDTPPQVGLKREERLNNLRGAFRHQEGVTPARRPVLIDDVQSTGTTLEEAAHVLLAAGAEAVFALTLCGEPQPRREGHGQRPKVTRGTLPYANLFRRSDDR